MFKSTSTSLAWPLPTALVLILIVGTWAFIGGFFEIFAAFRVGETAGTRALFIVAGLVTIALLFGLFSLMYGFSQIVTGTMLHQARHAVRAAVEDAA